MRYTDCEVWTLVRSDTKAPVNRGDAVVSGRGEHAIVAGGSPPHKPASTGRVYVREQSDIDNNSEYSREYFPSVFGLEWVREPAPRWHTRANGQPLDTEE